MTTCSISTDGREVWPTILRTTECRRRPYGSCVSGTSWPVGPTLVRGAPSTSTNQEDGDSWGYERGRQFAALHPEVRRLDADAAKLLQRAFRNRDILPG